MFRKVKFFGVISLIFILLFTTQVTAFSDVRFESSAGSAVLVEASTGQVIYDKNSEVPVPPASITKLMTLLIGFEAVEQGKAKWDDMVPVSEKAWKTEGSKMFLEAGHDVNYQELITGISVVSANDGCVALAEYLYGSEEAFVQVMNKRAQELGLKSAHFKNVTGLPAQGHVISARDIASLAGYLMEKFPKILEIESQREFTYNNIKQPNRNPLLGVFPGADGLKTGWTDEAGYCLVGTAEQNGMRLISVVLKTKDEAERLQASQEVLNYGFKNFDWVMMKKAGDDAGVVDVKNGKTRTASLKIDEDMRALVSGDEKDRMQVNISIESGSLKAPVEAGTVVGKAELQLDGKTIAVSNVSTAEEVKKANIFQMVFRAIGDFFRSLKK